MVRSKFLPIVGLVVLLLWAGLFGQKFLPDDPILKDPDDQTIAKPVRTELGPTWNIVMNSFGEKGEGPLLRAENKNTLGQVPDSSWFTNRIGVRDLPIDELVRGNDASGGPDLSGELWIVGAALISVREGLFLRDSRGKVYYIQFDPKSHPNLVSGSSIITNRAFHAIGYHVLPKYLIELDRSDLRLEPGAQVMQLGGKTVPLDEEYIDLAFEDAAVQPNGKTRAVATDLSHISLDSQVDGEGSGVGEFQFHGRRNDDPNDLFLHENRRELRGLRVFAAWLNYTLCNAIGTRDFYISEGGRSFLRHYFVDFLGSLGVGVDFINDQPVPKDARSGNEYLLSSNFNWTVKTAISFGFWYRPWMKVEFESEKYPELGRIEAENFQPELWLPEYPNPAFTRMLPDDAFWAATILSCFSDEAIDAIVSQAQYSDPGATELLANILKVRRDKLVDFYYRQINPLDDFKVEQGTLDFRNLGEERGLAAVTSYEYEWFQLDNETGILSPLIDRQFTALTRLNIPQTSAEYVMARIRTRSARERGWRKNVDVYLRMKENPEVVGIEREVGAFVLERSIEGVTVVRSAIEFAGTYEGLETAQQDLVEDWLRRVKAATGKSYDPEQFYQDLPMSVRTTFEAVTHALAESTLTDAEGNSFGRALDLIAQLERIRGKVKGAGGDEQFRIYVRLVPDAIEILNQSLEFQRGADNTVYHKGYPMNYRQQGGVPSLQISIAEDGVRADVDVDYRSSKFPGALLNGHLTSSNSDVRAGNNHERHVNRWEGFLNWWRGIFGLPQLGGVFEMGDPDRLLIPAFPRKGESENVDEAVEDFLTAWLIDNEPQEAVAYVEEDAFYCMEGINIEGGGLDFGIAPLVLLERLADVRASLGDPKKLSNVMVPAGLDNSRLRMATRVSDAPFVLYEVPEDLALAFDCARRDELKPAAEGRPDSYGKYFGSVFQLIGPKGKGAKAALLWTRVDKLWKIVSYEVEPEGGDIVAALEAAPAAPVVERASADPGFAVANEGFLRAWGQGRIDDAVSFLSPSCLDCFNLYAREDQEPVENWDQALAAWKEGLKRISDEVQKANNLFDVIEPVEVVHPKVRVVEHPYEHALTILSLPNYLAQQYDCAAIASGQVKFDTPAELEYGEFFATAIRFKLAGEQPAVLYLLWSQKAGEWKITSYALVRP